MPFVLGSAGRWPAPPFGISMLGRNEFALRNSPPPPAALNLRRTRGAAQKGRWVVLLLTDPKLKIAILTVPSKKKNICFQQMFFFLGSAAQRAAPPFGLSMLGVGKAAPSFWHCFARNRDLRNAQNAV